MTDDRWQRAQDVFDRLRGLPADRRAAEFDAACAGDTELRAEVESLLAHEAAAGGSFLRSPLATAGDSPSPHIEFAASPPRPAELPPWAESVVGLQIGRYKVTRLIGFGGMGAVFEAQQERPARTVALKLMQPGISAPSALARFRLEPEMLGRLQHPNIAQVYEAGVHQGEAGLIPFFAMEYIADACPLLEFAGRHELTIPRRIAMLAKVCDAVHHGHQKGIIHRDIKPANILVGGDGEPKVIDFGVARATDADILRTTQCTQSGELVGTLRYMSPEQCDGKPGAIDTRSDIYALGVALYQLLTGAAPYDVDGTTVYGAIRVIKEEPPRRPSKYDRQLRGDIDAILLKSLEKSPGRRYASALDLAEDLRRHLANIPILARPPSFLYVTRRYARRHVWQTAAAGFVLLALLGGLLVAVGYARVQADFAARQTELIEARAGQADRTLISAALAELSRGDVAAARERLVQVREQSRMWGWRHVLARTDQSLRLVRPANGVGDFPISVSATDPVKIARRVSDDRVEVFELETGRMVSELDFAPLRAIWRSIAAANGFGRELSTHRGWLAISPDGATLFVSLHQPGLVSMLARFDLSVPGGSPCAGFLRGRLHRIAFDPAGAIVIGTLVSPDTTQAIVLFHADRLLIEEGPHTSELEPAALIDADPLSCAHVRASTNGRWLGSVDEERGMFLWDLPGVLRGRGGSPSLRLNGHSDNRNGADFSPDCRLLATISSDGTVRLWDLERCVQVAAAQGDSAVAQAAPDCSAVIGRVSSAMRFVSFAHSGDSIYTSDGDQNLQVWARQTAGADARDVSPLDRWRLVNTLPGGPIDITGLHPLSGGRFVTSARNGEVRLWESRVESVPRLRSHYTSVFAVTTTRDGKWVISGDGAYDIYIWSPATGNPVGRLAMERGVIVRELTTWARGKEQRFAAAGCPVDHEHGRLIVCGMDEHARPHVILEYPDVEPSLAHPGFTAVKRCISGTRLVAADESGRIHVFQESAETGELRLERVFAAHDDHATALQFLDPTGRWLLSGGGGKYFSSETRDGSLRIWDLDSASETAAATYAGEKSVWALDYRADLALLAVATAEGGLSLRRVSFDHGRPLLGPPRQLFGHVDSVCGVAFHPTEPRLASCGADRTVRIWDVHTGHEIVAFRDLAGNLLNICFDPAGERLYAACQGTNGVDNVVAIWEGQQTPETRHARALFAEYYLAIRDAVQGPGGPVSLELMLDDYPAHIARIADQRRWPAEVREIALNRYENWIREWGDFAKPAWKIACEGWTHRIPESDWSVREPGAVERAVAHINRGLEISPWDPSLNLTRGALQYRLDRPREALVALRKVSGLANEHRYNRPALVSGALAFESLAELKLGDRPAAERAAEAFFAAYSTLSQQDREELAGVARELKSRVQDRAPLN